MSAAEKLPAKASEKKPDKTPEKKMEMIHLAVQATQEDVMTNMTSQLRAAARPSAERGGPHAVIRNTILTHITEERYEKAIESLTSYVNSRPEYPDFKRRSQKYFQYGTELIQAIEAKRSFPGWNVLNMSKQKDLFETALRHFEDFKATLGKIETIERDVQIEDVRSTVWVMRACVYSVCVLLVFAIAKEITGGVMPSMNVFIDATTGQIVDFIFDKLKL